MQVCKKFNNNTFIHNQVFELLKEIVYISDKLPLLFTKVHLFIFRLLIVKILLVFAKKLYQKTLANKVRSIKGNVFIYVKLLDIAIQRWV
jgi:hypothetical protein